MQFEIIKNTPLFSAFSNIGKRVFLPQGIFYWSDRAKNEAELIGTIGEAYAFERDFVNNSSTSWVPCYLECVKDYFNNLTIDNVVPYASIPGIKTLRQIWKDWIFKKSRFYDNSEQAQMLNDYISMPIVTAGVTNGIFLSCSLFLNPGEEIIAPNKRWGNYDNIIEKYIGAKIKPFVFFKEREFNLAGLSNAIDEVAASQKKIVMIVNFPNNPTGYMPSESETEEIIELLVKKQSILKIPFIVIVDDAYEPYVYKNYNSTSSFFYKLQQLKENIIPIKLDGVTKEFLIYGARIGFLTIGLKPSWVKAEEDMPQLNSELDNILSGFLRLIISNSNHFYQSIIIKFFIDQGLTSILEMRKKIYDLLKERYELINRELAKIDNPNVSIDPNSGGFFVFLNLKPERIKAPEFADRLLKKYKVGVIPIEKPLEQVNGIRIAYSSIDIKDIPEFIKRIDLALKEFK